MIPAKFVHVILSFQIFDIKFVDSIYDFEVQKLLDQQHQADKTCLILFD